MSNAGKVEAKETEMDGVLKRFMQEFFPSTEFKRIGIFTNEMKGNYKAQAEKICTFLGYKTVYEYRATEMRCHLSYAKDRPIDEPFITVIPSIYE